METLELMLRLWPVVLWSLGASFWLGVLHFRVTSNKEDAAKNCRDLERLRDKVQSLEVGQAGWQSTLDSINRHLSQIDDKIEQKK